MRILRIGNPRILSPPPLPVREVCGLVSKVTEDLDVRVYDLSNDEQSLLQEELNRSSTNLKIKFGKFLNPEYLTKHKDPVGHATSFQLEGEIEQQGDQLGVKNTDAVGQSVPDQLGGESVKFSEKQSQIKDSDSDDNREKKDMQCRSMELKSQRCIDENGGVIRLPDCEIAFARGTFLSHSVVKIKFETLDMANQNWLKEYVPVTPIVKVESQLELHKPASVKFTSWCVEDEDAEDAKLVVRIKHKTGSSRTWDDLTTTVLGDKLETKFECQKFCYIAGFVEWMKGCYLVKGFLYEMDHSNFEVAFFLSSQIKESQILESRNMIRWFNARKMKPHDVIRFKLISTTTGFQTDNMMHQFKLDESFLHAKSFHEYLTLKTEIKHDSAVDLVLRFYDEENRFDTEIPLRLEWKYNKGKAADEEKREFNIAQYTGEVVAMGNAKVGYNSQDGMSVVTGPSLAVKQSDVAGTSLGSSEDGNFFDELSKELSSIPSSSTKSELKRKILHMMKQAENNPDQSASSEP